jgi:hypothetical protein
MMNRAQLYLKKIIYNSKLNQEKFIINKKKMNERKTIQVRKFYTYQPKNTDPDPNPNQGPDLWSIFIVASVCYSIGKMNERKNR